MELSCEFLSANIATGKFLALWFVVAVSHNNKVLKWIDCGIAWEWPFFEIRWIVAKVVTVE